MYFNIVCLPRYTDISPGNCCDNSESRLGYPTQHLSLHMYSVCNVSVSSGNCDAHRYHCLSARARSMGQGNEFTLLYIVNESNLLISIELPTLVELDKNQDSNMP